MNTTKAILGMEQANKGFLLSPAIAAAISRALQTTTTGIYWDELIEPKSMSNSEPTSSAEVVSGYSIHEASSEATPTTTGQQYSSYLGSQSSLPLPPQLTTSNLPSSSSGISTATTSHPLQQQHRNLLLNLSLIAAATTQAPTSSSAPCFTQNTCTTTRRCMKGRRFQATHQLSTTPHPMVRFPPPTASINIVLPSVISSIKERELEVAECLAQMRNQSLQNAAVDLNPNASFFQSLTTPLPSLNTNQLLHGSPLQPTPSTDAMAEQLRTLQQLQLASQLHTQQQQQLASSSNSQQQMQSTTMRVPAASSELLNSQLLQALVQKLQQHQQAQGSSAANSQLFGAQPTYNPHHTPSPIQQQPAMVIPTTSAAVDQQQQLLLQCLAASKASQSLAALSPIRQQSNPGVKDSQPKVGGGELGSPSKYSKPRIVAPLKKRSILVPPHHNESDGEEDLIVHDRQQLQRQQQQVNRARAEIKNGQTEGGQALRLPYSSESCHTITKFLMNFNLSADVDFSKKAIESLIKRLRDKRDELDFFIQAVHDGGVQNANSPCVTIPRTLDGRLQVAGRKGFPHVVYSRIFRWPELHKNEIKHLPQCKAAFDMKCDSVCVNPFHYQRSVAASSSSHIDQVLENSQEVGLLSGQPALAPPKQHSPLQMDFLNTSACSSSSASYIQKMIEQHKVASLQLPVNSSNSTEGHRKQSLKPTADMTLSLSSSAQSKQWLADFSSALAMVQPNSTTESAIPASNHLSGSEDLKQQEQLVKTHTSLPLQLSPGIAEKLSQLRYDSQPSEQAKKQAIVSGEKLFWTA
uniref:MH1 domain-containing protein n=1 Tax=Ditylenchus dipsaci TaxID=166011 RepID=A0A915DEF1_9BILA